MKKHLSKILASIISAVAIFAIAVLCVFGAISVYRDKMLHSGNFEYLKDASDRVVLFVGDGMGENHIKTASAYLERDIFFDQFEIDGWVSTFSLNMFGPTDSAAAATALATGTKVNNGEVSLHNGKNIKSISEYAKQKGYSVGIVTTDSLCGATPAGFSAHATARGEQEQIISTQLESNIDLFLGAGASTYQNYKTDFENKGYLFANSFLELDKNTQKIFGVFETINNYISTDTAPTLSQLVDFATDFLEAKSGDKYFLMVEGAHIDKMSHKNKMTEMIQYLDEFDNAIKLAHTKLQITSNYSIIVTADHETGGLEYNGETKEQISKKMFTRTGHSSADVKYYIDWKLSKDIFPKFPNKIDNTAIFKICANLLNVA